MPLKPFEELSLDPLIFPIGGKEYRAKLIGVQDGLRLQAAIEGTDDSLNDQPPEVLWRMVVGEAWDEMLADNVPLEAMNRAGLAALADFRYGRAEAERVWEVGVSPEALAALAAAPNRAQRRASKRSSSTGAARKTRSRASTTGTTSRKATQPAQPAPKARAGRS